MSDKRKERVDDSAPNVDGERGGLVGSFLRKGVELTEALMSENEMLRNELVRLESDNARLRAQVASDDAIRDLLRTIESLERERNEALARSLQLEETSRRHQGRYVEIERELDDLAKVYVASFQLHTTLSLRRVVHHLKELLNQLLGAEAFVIYIVEEAEGVASPIGFEGIDESSLKAVPLGRGVVGEACASGVMRVSREEPLKAGSVEHPIAVVPLTLEGKPVGAISIVALLEQKSHWAAVDDEFFRLLASHAATALVAANLYARERDVSPALTGLRANL